MTEKCNPEDEKPPYNCPWCGAPAWREPIDIPPPPDYCWESDHGTREEYMEEWTHDLGEVPTEKETPMTDKTIAVPRELLMGLAESARVAYNCTTNDLHADRGEHALTLLRTPTPDDQRAAQPTTPEGWALVPVEPTRKMVRAGKHTIKGADTTFESLLATYAYSSMLAAAPKFGEEE